MARSNLKAVTQADPDAIIRKQLAKHYKGSILPSKNALASGELTRQVRELVADHRKIAAIELVGLHAGIGLKDAKDFVDNIDKNEGPGAGAPARPAAPEQLNILKLAAEGKIDEALEAGRRHSTGGASAGTPAPATHAPQPGIATPEAELTLDILEREVSEAHCALLAPKSILDLLSAYDLTDKAGEVFFAIERLVDAADEKFTHVEDMLARVIANDRRERLELIRGADRLMASSKE